MTEIRQPYLRFVMGLLRDFGPFSLLSVAKLWPFFSSRVDGGLPRPENGSPNIPHRCTWFSIPCHVTFAISMRKKRVLCIVTGEKRPISPHICPLSPHIQRYCIVMQPICMEPRRNTTEYRTCVRISLMNIIHE